MIYWPQTLIKEVAARRCIFFLGAGVSSSSQTVNGERPKGWKDFLNSVTSLIHNEDKKKYINDLISERRYLLALQAIYTNVDPSDYQDFINNNFNNYSFQPSQLHELIFDLDQRLVITTNFDKIYETYCHKVADEGFKVITYDSESLADEIRSDTRLIIKAHGSIDDINKMIFTKSQYHKMKRQFSNFYEILKALFISHTVIFIGCSLDDPDVQLIIEDVNIITSAQKPHYILIKRGSQNYFNLSNWKQTYNIKALEYSPTHDDLVTDLGTLLDSVNEIRSKQLNL